MKDERIKSLGFRFFCFFPSTLHFTPYTIHGKLFVNEPNRLTMEVKIYNNYLMKDFIETLPSSSGVYIMKGKFQEVLYVGKAKNLKKRVSSYFQGDVFSPRISLLVFEIKSIEYIVTDNEKDALILENELIKYLRPKYNVKLRDDKTYPYLRITVEDEYPRIEFTRRKPDDRSVYFGPYPDAKSLRTFLRFIGRIFPLAKCSKTKFNKFRKLNNPSACLDWHIKNCVAPCSKQISKKEYNKIVNELIEFLKAGTPKDIIKLWKNEMKKAVLNLEFEKAAEYKKKIKSLEDIGKKINFRKIEKNKYIAIGENGALTELARILKLPVFPEVIEGIDISNISGKEAVGSVVVFGKGMPEKMKYRRYKIKEVKGISDTDMMHEVVKRRFKRLKKDGKLPDLLLVDGGKGQVSLALMALKELGIKNFPVIGLSKKEEKVYFYRWKEPLKISKNSPALKLLQQIRDEAHRFAHSYHTLRRRKNLK